MKKRFALALVVAGMFAAGCSSDDDGGDDPVIDNGGTTITDPVDGEGTNTTPGTGGSDTVTDGPAEDAGPIELAVAGDAELSNFYTLFDAIFGGETFDERNTPEEAWTIFVPTNAAFGAAGAGNTPDDQKQRLLQRHVIADGKLTKTELASMSPIRVNAGDEYAVTGDASTLAIGGARVLDIIAEDSNTIVYRLDGFLADTSGN